MPKKKTLRPKTPKAAKKQTASSREHFGQAEVRKAREATKDYPP